MLVWRDDATVELWLIYIAYVYNALFTQSQVAS